MNLDKALSSGDLTVARFEEWLEEQIDGVNVYKEIDHTVTDGDAYQVDFHVGDGDHVVYVAHRPDGSTEITVGYAVYHSPFLVNRG